jgi:hypothetical protein
MLPSKQKHTKKNAQMNDLGAARQHHRIWHLNLKNPKGRKQRIPCKHTQSYNTQSQSRTQTVN